MSTKEVIQSYFKELTEKKSWEQYLAENMVFTTLAVPIKQVTGKPEYIESTRRFFSMIVSVEVRDMIIDGEKACVLTRYSLQPLQGDSFISEVAEIITVKSGKITSLDIYFDSAPFPKR